MPCHILAVFVCECLRDGRRHRHTLNLYQGPIVSGEFLYRRHFALGAFCIGGFLFREAFVLGGFLTGGLIVR